MREQLPILEEHEPTKEELEKSLSFKYKTFALAYIKNGGHGAEAAREAGYSYREAKRTASRILTTNDHVMRYIALLDAQTTDRAIESIVMSKQYVTEKLKLILDTGSLDTEAKASAGVSAGAQLCRMHGYEAPAKNLNINASAESLKQLDAILNKYESDY